MINIHIQSWRLDIAFHRQYFLNGSVIIVISPFTCLKANNLRTSLQLLMQYISIVTVSFYKHEYFTRVVTLLLIVVIVNRSSWCTYAYYYTNGDRYMLILLPKTSSFSFRIHFKCISTTTHINQNICLSKSLKKKTSFPP